MSFENCLSNRPKTFSVFDIAWYKDDRGWENSRQLCKPETKTRVCITVENKPIPIYWNSYLAARKLFFTPFFSRLFRLSLAPAICPWVYEDARLGGIEQKKSLRLNKNITFLLFLFPQGTEPSMYFDISSNLPTLWVFTSRYMQIQEKSCPMLLSFY